MALAAVEVVDEVDVDLTASEDVKAAAMTLVDADLTVVADVEAVTMTVVDVVTASQAQSLSALRPDLTKTPLSA